MYKIADNYETNGQAYKKSLDPRYMSTNNPWH